MENPLNSQEDNIWEQIHASLEKALEGLKPTEELQKSYPRRASSYEPPTNRPDRVIAPPEEARPCVVPSECPCCGYQVANGECRICASRRASTPSFMEYK